MQVVQAWLWFVGCLVGAGLVLNTFGLNLGNNPEGGYYYYSHFPEEEVPNSLWSKAAIMPCALGMGLCPGHNGNRAATAVIVVLVFTQHELARARRRSPEPSPSPSSEKDSTTLTTKTHVYATSRRSSFLLFCRQGSQALWLGPVSRPVPLLGSPAWKLPECLRPGLTWCRHTPDN